MADPEPTPSSEPINPPPADSVPTEPPPIPESPLPSATTGLEPPVLQPPPLEPPPEPTEIEPPPPTLSRGLAIALAAVGVLQLGLVILQTTTAPGSHPASYQIGAIIGATVIWPAIIIGLFAIGRRFRNARSRAIILLSVWGLFILGHLGNLSKQQAKPERLQFTGTLDNAPLPRPRSFSTAPIARPFSATLTPAIPEPRPSAEAFDFSSGSDKRMIKLIESVQQKRYHDVVAAYATACATRPTDVDLAVERVRFISHFFDAEDSPISSAAEDYETALSYLNATFPHSAEAVLFNLERKFGAEFDADARRSEIELDAWSVEQKARYWLLRAQRLPADSAGQRRSEYASFSFSRRATPEAGIILAQALHDLKRTSIAVEVLNHPCFESAPDWIRAQRMNLLFDLGRNAEALAAYDVLKKSAPTFVNHFDTAPRLARAGRLAEAHALLDQMQRHQNEWLARRRFEFELEFGNQADAIGAYRKLRAYGIKTDPLLRKRISVFQRFPTAPWNATDVGGLFAVGFVALLLAASPLLILAPVHYWSLWREKNGRHSSWLISPWGLSAAWAVMGTSLLAEVIATWWTRAELLEKAVTKAANASAPPLAVQVCSWTAVTLLILILLWRRRAWRLFGPGEWTWGKAVGIGLACALGAKVAITAYLLVVPAARSPLAQIAPVQLEFFRNMHGALGPFAFIAIVGIFVPVFEEVVLRGVLLGSFAKHIPWIAANTLQAAIFASLHGSLALAPFFFAFGYAAGELVRRSQGLFPAIAMHAGNNLLTGVSLLALNAKSGILN